MQRTKIRCTFILKYSRKLLCLQMRDFGNFAFFLPKKSTHVECHISTEKGSKKVKLRSKSRKMLDNFLKILHKRLVDISPRDISPRYIKHHVHFTPRTFHPTYVSPLVRFSLRTFHPRNMSLRIKYLV